jgi:hypothetical protein
MRRIIDGSSKSRLGNNTIALQARLQGYAGTD